MLSHHRLAAVLFISAIAFMAPRATLAANGASDEAQIRQALIDGCTATVARDTDGMIAPFRKTDPDQLTMFDMGPPRTRNYAQLRQADTDFASVIIGKPVCTYLEIHPVLLGRDAAYSWAILHAGGKLKNGQSLDLVVRSTDVWRKVSGHWLIVHEHNSFPVNLLTGQADLQSKP